MKNFNKTTITALIFLFLIAGNSYSLQNDVTEVIERGQKYYGKGMYEKAIREFTSALQVASYNSQLYYYRGRAYHAWEKFDQAISDYNIAIQIAPYNAEIYHNRGNVYYYKDMLEPAISDWSKSIRLCPDCNQSYDNRAYAYYELGLYDLAWKDLEKLESLGFIISKAFYQTLEQHSERGEDIKIIERSLKSDPKHKYALVLPQGYSLKKKTPLLIVVDEYKINARQQINEWKLITSSQGYILVYLKGFAWGFQEFKAQEDEKLIKIIKEIEKEFSVDKRKIFLVGFNEGAEFAHRFAFMHPEYLKAACLLSAGEYELTPPGYGRAKKIIFFIGTGKGGKKYRTALGFFYKLQDKGYAVKFDSFSLFGRRINSKMKYAVVDFLADFN